MLLLSESSGTQEGEPCSLFSVQLSWSQLCLRCRRICTAQTVFIIHIYNVVSSVLFLVPNTQLLLCHILLCLLVLLFSAIPPLWSNCCKFILGDTEHWDGFFFMSSSLWNLRSSIGRLNYFSHGVRILPFYDGLQIWTQLCKYFPQENVKCR